MKTLFENLLLSLLFDLNNSDYSCAYYTLNSNIGSSNPVLYSFAYLSNILFYPFTSNLWREIIM